MRQSAWSSAGVMPLLDGATIDFKEEIGHEGFTINNPNAKSGCGCGKSFQT